MKPPSTRNLVSSKAMSSRAVCVAANLQFAINDGDGDEVVGVGVAACGHMPWLCLLDFRSSLFRCAGSAWLTISRQSQHTRANDVGSTSIIRWGVGKLLRPLYKGRARPCRNPGLRGLPVAAWLLLEAHSRTELSRSLPLTVEPCIGLSRSNSEIVTSYKCSPTETIECPKPINPFYILEVRWLK